MGGPAGSLSLRRRLAAYLAAVAHRGRLALGEAVLLFLAAVVGVALTGGFGPALVAALGGFAVLDFFFTPPLHRPTIGAAEDLWALVVFVVVALAVSAVVDLAARRTRIDLADRTITPEQRLTPTEWQLREGLLRNPGKLITQRHLLQEVWGPRYGTETNYLRQYMARLRRKLEDDPTRPKHLLTEPGMGYRFQP